MLKFLQERNKVHCGDNMSRNEIRKTFDQGTEGVKKVGHWICPKCYHNKFIRTKGKRRCAKCGTSR